MPPRYFTNCGPSRRLAPLQDVTLRQSCHQVRHELSCSHPVGRRQLSASSNRDDVSAVPSSEVCDGCYRLLGAGHRAVTSSQRPSSVVSKHSTGYMFTILAHKSINLSRLARRTNNSIQLYYGPSSICTYYWRCCRKHDRISGLHEQSR